MNLITEIYCDSSHTGWGVYIPCCNLRAKGKYLNKVTTNEGEFLAMREALHESSAYCGESALIIIYSDSQLVVKCLTGGWHVKPQHLRILHQECQELYQELHKKGVNIHWIPREKNTKADELTH